MSRDDPDDLPRRTNTKLVIGLLAVGVMFVLFLLAVCLVGVLWWSKDAGGPGPEGGGQPAAVAP